MSGPNWFSTLNGFSKSYSSPISGWAWAQDTYHNCVSYLVFFLWNGNWFKHLLEIQIPFHLCKQISVFNPSLSAQSFDSPSFCGLEKVENALLLTMAL